MRALYIDYDFKVHTTDAEGLTAIETDAFDGMPDKVTECYRFVPAGSSYTKHGGVTVHGVFIQPFVTENELDAAQREYERELLATLQAENDALVADMAQMVEEIYQSDTEMMGL